MAHQLNAVLCGRVRFCVVRLAGHTEVLLAHKHCSGRWQSTTLWVTLESKMANCSTQDLCTDQM